MTPHYLSRSTALAVLAIFAAHTLAALVAEPLAARPEKQRRLMAAAREAKAAATAKKNRSSSSSDLVPTARVAVQASEQEVDLVAYHGLGSWVDLFNKGPWKDPSSTVRRMKRRGVRTIYLQTATYGSPRDVVWPRKVGEFIASAHHQGMRVVAWSVPSFVKPRVDFRRARAALLFRTGKGERFDSFALDIEADIIRDISKRNRRLVQLSDRLRRVAGSTYPLGAIIPDPGNARYWPSFPYKKVAKRYDVMVPMGYFTFRVRGYKKVRSYTSSNIRVIRKRTGDPKTPIHVIGGIADDVGVPGARGFIRAIKQHKVLGASLYDFPITSKETWKELKAIPAPKKPKKDPSGS